MDLDEFLDGPNKAQNRPPRFAPKAASKFKPKPRTKSEPSDSQPPPPPDPIESVPAPKEEEIGVKLDAKPEFVDDAVEMDVEVKPAEEEDEVDLMDADTDLEDEVVQEIDVYFNPSGDSKTRLYVFQYPLRPQWRPYDLDDTCKEVRLKPETSEVEIDLAVDVDSKNYNRDADQAVMMEKQTLATTWEPPHISGYAVGVLSGNKLHLSPIHAVVQLRPSMQHLDTTTKKMSKTPEQTNDNEEGWVPLKYLKVDHPFRMRHLNKMMAQDDSQIDFSMSSYNYLSSLCPDIDIFSSKGPPIRYLRTLPLEERIRTWLHKGPLLHRFGTLKRIAPDVPDEELLEVLQEYARVVQGLWVLKSSLLYGKEIGPEVMSRNYPLLLFSKNVTIKSSQLEPLPNTLLNPVKGFLNKLAVHSLASDAWTLKENPDLGFVKSNPFLMKKQEEAWEIEEQRFVNFFSSKKKEKKGAVVKLPIRPTNNKPIKSPTSTIPSKVAARATNGATPKAAAMPEEVREAVTKSLQKLFKTVKICSFQQITHLLRDMAISASKLSTGFSKEAVIAASNIDTYPDEVQTIINQVAVNVHGICVPKSSPDNPDYDPFRKVVIDLLIAQGPNAKLKKSIINEAAKMELQREPTPAEYQKVLTEICTSQGGAWGLKNASANPLKA